MHYKNGREAQENDFVVTLGWEGGNQKVIAGRISELNPNTTCCNGVLTYSKQGTMTSFSVNVGDCYAAEDAFKAIEALMPPPPQADVVTQAPQPATVADQVTDVNKR